MLRDWRPGTGARSRRIVIIGIVLVAALVAMFVGWRVANSPAPHVVSFTELSVLAQEAELTRVAFEGERVHAVTADGKEHIAVVAGDATRAELARGLAERGVPVSFEASSPAPQMQRLALGGSFLLLVAMVLGATFLMRRRRDGHFGMYEPAPDAPGFRAVAGLDEAKTALSETVAFLREPGHFAKLGARPPRGILLTGEPGTGKTLLARAAAQEACVPFLTSSGSSFQEMFVGVGAARVRRLFAEARRLAPCVVFIDEIDAVGRARGGAADSSSAEHDRTLNQLLVEMDGFDATSGIVVIATTNRPDMLDPALVRPGRFDRQIHVPLPTMVERRAILDVHAAKLVLDEELSLTKLARTTAGLSGAQLENLLNEAALLAAREHDTAVREMHIAEARDRILMGAERKTMVLEEQERYATAVHEAGHVVVAMTATECDPVHKVTILPRGRALGVTQSLPDRDRAMYTKEFLEDRICMLLGGRAAEIEVLGTMTAGAADDLERASELARKMAGELGMSDLGCLHVGRDVQRVHGALLERVEHAAREILDAQLVRARQMVRTRRAGLDALTSALLERDVLEAAEVEALLPKGSLPAVVAA